ncbi:MAG TPA: hypothetical protein VLF61_01435 [Rhabdochlamydiaceae bacterium]|nr:hypothetical protein [Rhabdochlamydiaceae bacterium]
MNDTSPEMMEKMHELIRAKTPSERANMGCSMFNTSRTLVIDAILRENPNISKVDLKKELFLRFYGDDCSQETKEAFFRRLEN